MALKLWSSILEWLLYEECTLKEISLQSVRGVGETYVIISTIRIFKKEISLGNTTQLPSQNALRDLKWFTVDRG